MHPGTLEEALIEFTLEQINLYKYYKDNVRASERDVKRHKSLAERMLAVCEELPECPMTLRAEMDTSDVNIPGYINNSVGEFHLFDEGWFSMSPDKVGPFKTFGEAQKWAREV